MVSENLRSRCLKPEQREEVIAELAAHLEDIYSECRGQGMSDALAFQACARQVAEAEKIVRTIERTKEGLMNYRTKTLWLPGLVTFAAASILLVILQQVSLFGRSFFGCKDKRWELTFDG